MGLYHDLEGTPYKHDSGRARQPSRSRCRCRRGGGRAAPPGRGRCRGGQRLMAASLGEPDPLGTKSTPNRGTRAILPAAPAPPRLASPRPGGRQESGGRGRAARPGTGTGGRGRGKAAGGRAACRGASRFRFAAAFGKFEARQ